MQLTAADWHDFQINLLAGGVFFLAEIVFLLILIPIVIEWIDRRRWKPQSEQFVSDILAQQSLRFDVLASKIKAAFDSVSIFTDPTPWLTDHLNVHLSKNHRDMADLRNKAETGLVLYQRALTPQLHRAFVDWREAVEEWEDQLLTFATAGTHWVYNGFDGDEGRNRIVGELKRAFEAISVRSRSMRDCADLPLTLKREGRPDLDLRTEQILTDQHWDWLNDALMVARIGPRMNS